ncbi:SDR family NAD(P)-dependent oxidoreductase [Nonomuraea sp. NPDC001831]|uniref:SDR family NAD(P)-dependent oxidoreductase n=1 Tax=Nonomuraea sp. NPDC001831 TaxID=3364340 RepID=UPI0036C882EE
MTLNDLTGKTALITGSTGGIGMETARGLAGLGASVILVGTDRVRAQRAAQEIRAGAGNDRVEGLTGAYFDDRCRRKPLPAGALDERNQNAVWDLCVRLSVGILNESTM